MPVVVQPRDRIVLHPDELELAPRARIGLGADRAERAVRDVIDHRPRRIDDVGRRAEFTRQVPIGHARRVRAFSRPRHARNVRRTREITLQKRSRTVELRVRRVRIAVVNDPRLCRRSARGLVDSDATIERVVSICTRCDHRPRRILLAESRHLVAIIPSACPNIVQCGENS